MMVVWANDIALTVIFGLYGSTGEECGLAVNLWVELLNALGLNVFSGVEQDVGCFFREVSLIDLRYFFVIVFIPFLIELVEHEWGVMAIT